jgi:hypothetical protein
MKFVRTTAHFFDSRSLALFAAMALGGAGALHAQGGMPQSGSNKGTPAATIGPSSKAETQSAVGAAFERADTNQDGKLSPQEAAQMPAVAQRFKELDTDKDGALSRTEFEKGVQS